MRAERNQKTTRLPVAFAYRGKTTWHCASISKSSDRRMSQAQSPARVLV